MIRTSNIVNPIDVLNLGTEYYTDATVYAHGQNIPIVFIGDKLFVTDYVIRAAGHTPDDHYESYYIDGAGESKVTHRLLVNWDFRITEIRITLYNIRYLEVNGRVIFDRR